MAHKTRWANQPVVGVKRLKWRMDDEHADEADTEFAKIREEMLKRDNYTCRFCGFRSSKYQEIHHFDDNHQNNTPANLVTVCTLCHQVHHIGLAGQRGGAFFALLPELSQVEVNHIARAYWVTLRSQESQDHKDKLTGLYALFRARADNLKAAFGVDLSSPTLFAQVLSVCDDKLFAERAQLLESLRLVATEEAFHPGQLAHYTVNARGQFAVAAWGDFRRQLLE